MSATRPHGSRAPFAGPLPGGAPVAEARETESSPRRLGGSLSADIHLLGELLGEAIEEGSGSPVLALEERSRSLAQSFRAGDERAADELAALAADVSLDDAEVLIRAFTKYFQLVNLAEDNDRVRRLRTKEAKRAPIRDRDRCVRRFTRCASAASTRGDSKSCCRGRR